MDRNQQVGLGLGQGCIFFSYLPTGCWLTSSLTCSCHQRPPAASTHHPAPPPSTWDLYTRSAPSTHPLLPLHVTQGPSLLGGTPARGPPPLHISSHLFTWSCENLGAGEMQGSQVGGDSV